MRETNALFYVTLTLFYLIYAAYLLIVRSSFKLVLVCREAVKRYDRNLFTAFNVRGNGKSGRACKR